MLPAILAAAPDPGRAYARHCAPCHGPGGRGDGPLARELATPPRDLTRAGGWRNGVDLASVLGTLDTGIPGTAMGSYRHLEPGERLALAEEVLRLRAAGGAAPWITERLGRCVPLDLPLRDEGNRPRVLGELLGRPTLLTLNYFGCESVCTPQLNALARALGSMGAGPGPAFQVLTVSFDPRDTPALAARKRDNHFRLAGRPLRPEAWRFLTGEDWATRALAEAVGFRFEKRGEGFAHPTVLVVLAPGGRVAGYLHGSGWGAGELLRAVRIAAGPASAGAEEACLPPASGADRHRFSPGGCLAGVLGVLALIFLVARLMGRAMGRGG